MAGWNCNLEMQDRQKNMHCVNVITFPWFQSHFKALLLQILAGDSSVETDHPSYPSLDSTAMVSGIFHLQFRVDILSYRHVIRKFE